MNNVAHNFVAVIEQWKSYYTKNGPDDDPPNDDRWSELKALRSRLPDMKDGDQKNRVPIAELGGRKFSYMVSKGFCDKEGQASLSSLVAL